MDFAMHLKSNKKFVAALKIAGFLAVEALAVLLVYYWRVFYYLDARGVAALPFMGAVCALAGLLYLLFLGVWRLCKTTPKRTAACIFACGLLVCFANPPMQTPDETSHFLRSYRISQGCFVFDANNTFPEDVSRLMQAFPGAWVSAHTSQGVRPQEPGGKLPQNNPVDAVENTQGVWSIGEGWSVYNSQQHAMKQYGETGAVQGPADGFAWYFSGEPAQTPAAEPLNFGIFPYFATSVGIALARLLGFGALGCFYAGRVANLLVYTLLCYGALARLKRMHPVFIAIMLMPMSLYMAASYNYDAIILGCYYFAATFFLQRTWSNRDVAAFCVVFLTMNIIKPWINLLWLAVLLFQDRKEWKAKLRPWMVVGLCVVGAVLASRVVDWYGAAFRYNYGTIGRQLGDTVDQMGQLKFVLRNPLRYLAVLIGTLYENNFYLGQLGVFGALDLPIPAINLLSPMVVLMGAVLAVPKQKPCCAVRSVGLSVWGLVYLAGAITAMYITWTPVGMVRVIGFQARYLLPVFLVWAVALTKALSHCLSLRVDTQKAEAVALHISTGFAVMGAVLLFQHYFIGPVYTI